jgi:hypothetical protein
MVDGSGASGGPRGVAPAALIALGTSLGCAAGCWFFGSPRAALFSLFGAAAGAATQGVAVWFLLRSLNQATVRFLGAFALASLFRVAGGALVVLLALAFELPEPSGFFAGFVTLYVALEVVTDVWLVRGLRRPEAPDREADQSGRERQRADR